MRKQVFLEMNDISRCITWV